MQVKRDSGEMDEMKRDVLREIANIGSGHAATALSALLGRPVTQSVPDVRLVALAEMPSCSEARRNRRGGHAPPHR
jgi:chemotaxis protein CheY-P-specific phosphatase CheC